MFRASNSSGRRCLTNSMPLMVSSRPIINSDCNMQRMQYRTEFVMQSLLTSSRPIHKFRFHHAVHAVQNSSYSPQCAVPIILVALVQQTCRHAPGASVVGFIRAPVRFALSCKLAAHRIPMGSGLHASKHILRPGAPSQWSLVRCQPTCIRSDAIALFVCPEMCSWTCVLIQSLSFKL